MLISHHGHLSVAEQRKREQPQKMKKVVPHGADFLQQKVTAIQAVERIIRLDNKEQVNYEYLVVALGLQLDFDKIAGLSETLGKNQVCTNYLYDYVDYTYKSLKKVKAGNVIVTKPSTPIKGGVAPENSCLPSMSSSRTRKRAGRL